MLIRTRCACVCVCSSCVSKSKSLYLFQRSDASDRLVLFPNQNACITTTSIIKRQLLSAELFLSLMHRFGRSSLAVAGERFTLFHASLSFQKRYNIIALSFHSSQNCQLPIKIRIMRVGVPTDFR